MSAATKPKACGHIDHTDTEPPATSLPAEPSLQDRKPLQEDEIEALFLDWIEGI